LCVFSMFCCSLWWLIIGRSSIDTGKGRRVLMGEYGYGRM
jgi:hypothetical protein